MFRLWQSLMLGYLSMLMGKHLSHESKGIRKEMVKIVSEGVGIVGGCCGTTPGISDIFLKPLEDLLRHLFRTNI